jgi:hypothetical protein
MAFSLAVFGVSKNARYDSIWTNNVREIYAKEVPNRGLGRWFDQRQLELPF